MSGVARRATRAGALATATALGASLLAAIPSGGMMPPAAAAPAPEATRERLERVEAELARLRSRLEARETDRDALAEQLRRSDLALARLAQAARTGERRLRAARERLEALRGEHDAIAARERATRQRLAAHIRSAHIVGPAGPLKLLLNAERPERAARLMRYQQRISAAHRRSLERYRQAIDALLAQRESVRAQEQALAEAQRRVIAEREALAAAREQRAQALARLDSRIEADRSAVTELRENRERLTDLLQQLERQGRGTLDGESFAANRGRLPWPVDGSIRHAFGATRPDGKTRFDGVVLAAEPGAPVRAVHAGRVVFAEWMRGFGLLVIVDHGAGYMTLYAHNESLLREPGSRVEPGEALATAGQSGGAERSGVYFEIRNRGRPEDPAAWCRAGSAAGG